MGTRRPSIFTPGTLYTVGYAAPSDVARLAQVMSDERARLLDIRYSPRSRWWPEWNRSALQAQYGSRYVWEQRLGNVHYRQRELGIQLAEGHVQALDEAASLLCQGTHLILLCVCKDERTCHRSLVAKLIQDAVQAQKSGVDAISIGLLSAEGCDVGCNR